MKRYSLLSLFCVFLSCNMSDMVIDLGNDYQLVLESADDQQIIGKQRIYPNIKKYTFNERFILAKQVSIENGYGELIGYDLYSRYQTYSDFIKDTARFRKENRFAPIKDSSLYKIMKGKGISTNNTREDIEKYHLIGDSVMKRDVVYQKILSLKEVFWIIDKRNDSLYGPYNEAAFLQKRVALNIPQELQLQDVP